MTFWQKTEVKHAVDTYIANFCDSKQRQAAVYDATYERLWGEMKQYLLRGGKRVRPYLVILGYQSHGGGDVETIIPVAAAWEMLHAALLVHDDIIDRDTTRHGHLNIQGEYEKYYEDTQDTVHYAQGAALLSGDLLIASAFEMVLESSLDAHQKSRAQTLLCKAIFGVAGGELMDVETVFDSIAEAKTEKVARFKTAEYSCEYPLWCGAELAGAKEAAIQHVRALAVPLGIGYQLVDDLLGVFGESSVTGKSNSGDIREKKRTMLLQKTLETLDPALRTELEELYAQTHELDEKDIARVKALIAESGARLALTKEVDRYYREAAACVDELDVIDGAQAEYRALLDVFLRREL